MKGRSGSGEHRRGSFRAKAGIDLRRTQARRSEGSRIIGAHNINITSYLNESTGVIGYNIIDLESPIPKKVLGKSVSKADLEDILGFGPGGV